MILFVFNGKHSARGRSSRDPGGKSRTQLLLKSWPLLSPAPNRTSPSSLEIGFQVEGDTLLQLGRWLSREQACLAVTQFCHPV